MTDNTAQTLAERGRAARSRRSVIRHHIATGMIDVPALLDGDGEEEVEAEAMNMTVAALVGAVPGLGDDAVDRILNGRCGPRRRLGEVTTRARRAIADTLRKELAS